MKPRVSFVVPTDTWGTIAEIVRTLESQTIASEIELVAVGPDSLETGAARLACVTVVAGAKDDVPRAHAAGVAAASAPVVFLGETHAFPAPDALERLAARLEDPTVGVAVPRLTNANPATARSWAALLVAYGGWVTSHARDLETAAGFNSAWRRDLLLALGDDLPSVLGAGAGADLAARRAGWRIVAEPLATVAHRNVTAGTAWLRSRALSARAYAAARSASWPRIRRLAYAVGSPLLVPLITVRVRRSDGWLELGDRLPRHMTAAVFVLAIATAVGEGAGYAMGAGDARRRVAELEIRRANYV